MKELNTSSIKNQARTGLEAVRVSAPHSYFDFPKIEVDEQAQTFTLTIPLITSYAAVENFNLGVFVEQINAGIRSINPQQLAKAHGFTVEHQYLEASESDIQNQINKEKSDCSDDIHMHEDEFECDEDEYSHKKDLGIELNHRIVFTKSVA